MARCSSQPQQPCVCDTLKSCEDPSRLAGMGGNRGVMLGKVVSGKRKEDDCKVEMNGSFVIHGMRVMRGACA